MTAPRAISHSAIGTLKALESGWDGYGSPPVSGEAIEILLDIFVVPTTTGGFQLEWHKNGEDIEIEVDANGHVKSAQLGPFLEWQRE